MAVKKLLALLLVITLTGVWAGSAFGADELNNDTKWRLYTAESKNPWIAAGVAYAFTPYLPLGHVYAGDWKRGLPFTASCWIGLEMLHRYGNYGNGEIAVLGIFLYGGAWIWGSVDAYNTAEEHNSKLKKQYGLSLQLRNNLPVFTYTYKFLSL